MERLNIIIFLFVLSVYGCSTTDTRNPRQIYFSNSGDTISLFSSGNTDKILIRSHGGEGRCDIINEPQPHIHGIAGDTIFIWYDYMHRVDNPDTNITGFIKQISIGQYRYVIKGVQNYLNGKKMPYDCYIACYHDQGLIPIKSVASERTVNMTIGLDIIRTSPSHGTAFDIAGKDIANPDSMIEAIKHCLY